MKASLLKIRRFLITISHLVIISLSVIVAFWIRFEFSLTTPEYDVLFASLMLVVPIKMVVFLVGGLHKGWWRYAGLGDLVRIYLVNVAASGISAICLFAYFGSGFPRSVYVIDFLICFLLTGGARFCVRLYKETFRSEGPAEGKGILIYGAGDAGRTLLREIRMNPCLGFHVAGFIDDNPLLRSIRIMDVPVLGTGRDIGLIVDRYARRHTKIDEVVIAMPSAAGRQMREAHANCRAGGVACRTIPGIGDLLTGKYLSAQLRSLSLEDLLGREPIRLEEHRIRERISGNSILITGAAGSIGSELCRQTASFRPKKLVILDQAESELFKIDQELRHQNPDLEIVPVVGDIRNFRSIEEVVRTHAVGCIYHAAAYKHVPMMEAHVLEAVRNNIIGTWNLVRAAYRHRVSNFLMISSDKAVNPTSVMGVTKRIAELIVSTASNGPANGTMFVSVRFGNVLGSNGSVVPIFQSQIVAGGPVTVTHPEMRRYFMSIREAVQLVLQASTMGKGSEIFVLDMGEPVRILDLAQNMIQLAGLTPNEDIEIRITGLRPGEKLYEEIALDGENMLPTYHPKIKIFKGAAPELEALSAWLNQLQSLIGRRDVARILDHLAVLVPEYKLQKSKEQEPPKPRITRTAVAGASGVSSTRVSKVLSRSSFL
jgi:FlaA1/EpsC-like NDP-sugar epimerase